MDNKSIIKQLKQTVSLMELYEENSFKVRRFNSAIEQLERLQQPLANMSREEIEQLEGVGKSIASEITALVQETGDSLTEKLSSKTPAGILEMLEIKGIGPKKIKTLWEELGIEDIHSLLEACNAGKVAGLKGFGKKTQDNIIKILQFVLTNAQKIHFATIEPFVNDLKEQMQQAFPALTLDVTGDFRRNSIIIEKIEFLVAWEQKNTIEDVKAFFNALDSLSADPGAGGPFTWRGHINNENMKDLPALPVVIHFCPENKFYNRLLHLTGSQKHLATFLNGTNADETSGREPAGPTNLFNIAANHHFTHEAEAYRMAGLPYIPPELREGHIEFKLARSGKIPELVKMEDLKGIIHNHSTFSDGKNSLEEMAQACKEMGYAYFGIADHSPAAFYANGLDVNRLQQQHREIDRLNEKLAPFKIFKGVESDILNDGSLDYPGEVLATLDYVVASIHGNLKMDVNKATQRLIQAIQNPYTTILGHPTGRLLLQREGYPIDQKAVIQACAENNVAIEINAHPWRLDLDWHWIPYAMDQGVMISINPDAHEQAGLQYMYYGLLAARKGALTANMTLNALTREQLEAYFVQRKKDRR